MKRQLYQSWNSLYRRLNVLYHSDQPGRGWSTTKKLELMTTAAGRMTVTAWPGPQPQDVNTEITQVVLPTEKNDDMSRTQRWTP